MSERVYGLRVAALLKAVEARASKARSLARSGDHEDGKETGFTAAADLIRQHIGEPTPEERAATEDGTTEPISADVLPGEYEAAGVAVAMMRSPKVGAVVAEVLALAPALADIGGGPGTVDDAWRDIGREAQEQCGRDGLLTIAMLAIHGILACDAKGGA